LEKCPHLRIKLIGGFEFFTDQFDAAKPLSHCDQRLLAFLSWKCGTQISREKLVDTLWPDLPPKRAMRALNTSLWRIRRAIRSGGNSVRHYIRTTRTDVILLDSGTVQSDAALVEAQATRVLELPVDAVSDDLLKDIEDIVVAHSGTFFPDCYDDWCHVPRETLHNRYADLQEFLVLALIARQQWKKAIVFAQAVLDKEPMQESAHQWLIQCYLALGDRMRAQAQFDQCASCLHDELGVDPLPQTIALLDGMQARKHTDLRSPSIRLDDIIRKLDAARESVVQLGAEI